MLLALMVTVAGAAGPSRASGASPGIGGYHVYYGQLHSHTSLSDGSGTPDEAYRYARDTAKLDFFAIADHCSYPYDRMMTVAGYQGMQATANRYNHDGVFVTFWGFEWTSDDTSWGGPSTLLGKGHVTVINSPDFCRATDQATNELNELVEWMSTRDVIAFFNHPGQYKTTFDKFAFNHADTIVGMELWNGSTDYYANDGYYGDDGGLGYYDEAINRGWHIGAAGSGDNHAGDWGTQNEWRMAVLAPEKTRASIYAAMKARRFYSSRDRNLALSFTCNGAQMGSSIAGGTLDIDIEATDADGEIFSRIDLLKNGTVVQTWSPNVTHPHVTTTQDGRQGDDFYVRVYQSGEWAAISSPVFITGSRARSGSRTVARAPGGSGGSAFTLHR
jgi:hypothetical protein